MTVEILIVDDNSDIRNILNELIIDAGYKTRIAANYNQALSEIDKKIPDVAILDVKLDKGDNDGIELLTHIKSKNKDVPVIIIDNGIGFDNFANNVKDILNPYFTTKKDGTGLGLSIVNKIVNDHNGIIKFIPINDGAKIEIIFNLNDSRNFNSWWQCRHKEYP